MTYAVIAVERAMKIQEVILRAMSGALTWPQAADILGMHPRSLRRWRARQQRVGYDGLLDRRRQRPSPRGARYTGPAGWAFLTPKAGGPIDGTHLTHVGRALAHLGIEHIGAYSPQARGRGERLNRTLQDRLVNELRLAGIATLEAANAYLRERFIPDHNARFSHPPADSTAALVALGDVDLDQILCEEDERTVAPDNTVSFDTVRLQLAKQPGRPTCAGARVTVRRHLDGRFTVWRGPTRLGLYAASGVPVPARVEQAANGHFRVAGADRPPMRPRRIVRATAGRQRRLGPRLPVGPGF